MSQLELTLAAVAEHGWQVVLLGSGANGKKPTGQTWQITSNPDILRAHVEKGFNIGLVCGPKSQVAVLDFDVPDLMSAMFQELGPLELTVETGSGKYHVYVQWVPDLLPKINWLGSKVGEVQRGGTTLLQHVVIPPSLHPTTHKPYLWLTPKVQVLPEGWLSYLTTSISEDRLRHEALKHDIDLPTRVVLARRWLEKRPPAIQGRQGDIHTYITVASICYDHDLDEESAFAVLEPWNMKCIPPWSERELREKIRSATRHATGARGEKLLLYELTPKPTWIPSGTDGTAFLESFWAPITRYKAFSNE